MPRSHLLTQILPTKGNTDQGIHSHLEQAPRPFQTRSPHRRAWLLATMLCPRHILQVPFVFSRLGITSCVQKMRSLTPEEGKQGVALSVNSAPPAPPATVGAAEMLFLEPGWQDGHGRRPRCLSRPVDHWGLLHQSPVVSGALQVLIFIETLFFPLS